MTKACCCGKGLNTPTGRPYYCTRHMRWSDAPVPAAPPPEADGIEWAKGYNDWRRELDDVEWAKDNQRLIEKARAHLLARTPGRLKMRYKEMSDSPQSHVTHGYVKHGYADIVYSVSNGRDGHSMSTWMVPGTYRAEDDTPPPRVIAAMFGHPFDVDNWRVKLGEQFWSADDLRMVAQNMDDCKVIYDDKVSAPHKWGDKEIRMNAGGWRH